MPTISKETKSNIANVIGLDFDTITNLDLEDEIKFVTKKNKCKPIFSKIVDSRKVGRGNPLVSRSQFKLIEEVNEGLEKIK